MANHDDNQGETRPDVAADVSDFDADAAAARLRMTDQDKAFALAMLGGANRTQAARMAGFPQQGLALRKKGSSLAATRKIKAFLELARAAGVGAAPDEVIDKETRRRLLSRDAVSNDRQVALRAIEQLNKMDDVALAGESPDDSGDPVMTLIELANFGGGLLGLADQDFLSGARALARGAGLETKFEAAWSAHKLLQQAVVGSPNGGAAVPPATTGARG